MSPQHSGRLYALYATSGEPGLALSSRAISSIRPAIGKGLIVAASSDGAVYAVKPEFGELAWSEFISWGGFAASPLIRG
jgi:outer membrane protein assembly factor BamB